MSEVKDSQTASDMPSPLVSTNNPNSNPSFVYLQKKDARKWLNPLITVEKILHEADLQMAFAQLALTENKRLVPLQSCDKPNTKEGTLCLGSSAPPEEIRRKIAEVDSKTGDPDAKARLDHMRRFVHNVQREWLDHQAVDGHHRFPLRLGGGKYGLISEFPDLHFIAYCYIHMNPTSTKRVEDRVIVQIAPPTLQMCVEASTRSINPALNIRQGIECNWCVALPAFTA